MAGHYETGYAETEALRRLMLGDANGAETILNDLTVEERNELAARARELTDLAYVPGWGEMGEEG